MVEHGNGSIHTPLVGRLEVPEEVEDEEGADDDVVEVADRREHHEPRLVKRPSNAVVVVKFGGGQMRLWSNAAVVVKCCGCGQMLRLSNAAVAKRGQTRSKERRRGGTGQADPGWRVKRGDADRAHRRS
jgi:hypothetical protein